VKKTAAVITSVGLIAIGLVRATVAHAAATPATPVLQAQSPAQTPAPARERPAMVPCPWPAAMGDTVGPDPSAPPPPTGVVDPPRRRIPIAPPGWTAPAASDPTAPTLPSDRPKPVVDSYLAYVVTAPPPEIVERFKLDTSYLKFADANSPGRLGQVPDAVWPSFATRSTTCSPTVRTCAIQ
jgi:hypothetical protein